LRARRDPASNQWSRENQPPSHVMVNIVHRRSRGEGLKNLVFYNRQRFGGGKLRKRERMVSVVRRP